MKSSISHLWLRPSVCTSLLALVAAAAFSACTSEKAVPREDAGLSCTPELCAEQNLLCDSASGLCVECLAKTDCGDECKDCVDNVCQDIPGCNSPCLSGVTGEDGSCLNSQKVECTPVAADALPENAESVNAQVTITWTQEGGWTSPETCAWKCSDGFTKTADGEGCQPIQPVSCTRDEDCIDMGCDTGKAECALFKTVPCDADALPEHAVADKPTAEVAWDAVSGWADAPACEWTRCEADWHIMDEAVQTVCVYNTANMLCAGMDALPAHAVVDNPNVIVLWNEAANAWNEIPQCNWVACEEGFYKDGDQCARGESTTDCAGMDSVPSHADVLNPLVSIHYDSATGEWTKPEACRWKCIEGWHLDDKVCVTNDSYSLPCTGTVPENSVVTNPYIPQTWNEASQSWEPGSQGCTFACRKGFHFVPARGICESDTREETCTGAENLPEHAVADNPFVTVHYENGTWTSPEACTWSKCEEGWHAENNACASNEKEVACHDAAPAHAVSIPANVVVTWNEEEGAWNAPADCAWDCLQNYHPADNGCAGDEQDVECLGGTPANATASNATIHQIYGDNGWEPAATDCDWKCNSGFHTEDGQNCVSNSTTRLCNDVAPAHATSDSVLVSVSWNEEEGRWNNPVNCSWRCDANYHKTPAKDACVGDEQDVECLGGTPANATSSNATIHQTYGDNGWEPAATDCEWQCNANFHTEDGRTCDPNTKLVDCIDAAPAHAQSENAQVPVQWNETEHKWETAQNCVWNCDSSYHPENGGCVWTCTEGLVNDTNDGCIDCRNNDDCDSATEYCDHNECVAWCGNGTADHGEACDWNDTSFDTSCPAWHSGSKSCSRSCAIVDNCAAPTVTCRSAPRNVTLGLNGSVTLETHFSVTAGDTVWTNAAWNPDNAPLSNIRLMVRTSGSGQWQALSGNYGAPATDGADANSLRVTYAVTTADGLADGTYDAIWGFTMDGQDYWCPMDAAVQAAPVADINSAPAFISLNVSSDHCDNNSDCASGICEANGACATQQVVSCAAVTSGIPEHGHANPASDVTIYWNGTAWDPVPSCGWSCDDDFHLNGDTCDSNSRTVDCTGRENLPAHAIITNASVAQTWNGSAWTPSDIACVWNGCEADWHVEDDDCVSNSKQVACRDAAPANAAPVNALVTVTWNANANAWNQTPACAWNCVSGFHTEDDATCISNTRQELCTDPQIAHATTTHANVTVTWTAGSGWSAPAECAWSCNANYHPVGKSCAGDEQDVPCTGTIPEHATASNATIHQTFGDNGWAPAAEACRWTCDGGFHEEHSACVSDDATAPCTDAAPANAISTIVNVAIHWNGNAWSTPANCEWSCISGFHTEDGATCVSNSKEVACTSAAPDNASSINALVTVTWTEGSGWSNAANCEWNCNAGFHTENQTTCISDDDTAPCHDAAPANAASVSANVPIHWNGNAWSDPADCAWNCNPDFHRVNDACVSNTDSVPCIDNHPIHSQPVLTNVTVTWNTTTSSWNPTPECAWNCDANYHKNQTGDACVGDERDVPCIGTIPQHATASNENIHQIYGDNGWEPEAEACDWDCVSGFHTEDDATCISNTKEVACHNAAPENATSVNANVTVTWTQANGWSTPANCAWNCNANFHTENNTTCISDDATAPCRDAAPANATSVNADVPIHWTEANGWSTPADCAWNCNSGYFPSGDSCVAYCGDGQINNGELCDYNNGHPIYAAAANCPDFYHDNRGCTESCQLSGSCDAPKQWCRIVGGTDEAGLRIGRDDGTKDTSYAQFYIEGLTDKGHAPDSEQFKAELFVKIGQGGDEGWFKLGSEFNKIADRNNAEMKADVSFELLRNAGADPDYIIENSPFSYVWRYQFGQEEKWHYCTIVGSENNQTPTELSEVTPDGKLTVHFCIVNQCGSGEFEGKFCDPNKNEGRGDWIGCDSGVCYDLPDNGGPMCLECNAEKGCPEGQFCLVKENPKDNYCTDSERQMDCTSSKPAHSHYNPATFTQNWNGTTWEPPENYECHWDCDEHYHLSTNGGSCEPDTQTTECTCPSLPNHGVCVPSTFQQTWTDSGWDPASQTCTWDCASGFHKVGSECVSNTQTIACNNTKPAHSSYDSPGTFTQTWNGSGWDPQTSECTWHCDNGYYPSGESCVAYCGDGQINNGEDCDYNHGSPIYAAGNCPDFYFDNRNCSNTCQFSGSCDEPNQWCRIVGGTDEAGLTIGLDDGTKDTSYAQFYIEGLTDRGHAPEADQFTAELFIKIGQGGEDGWVKLSSEFNKIADRNNAEMMADVSFERLQNAGVDPGYLIDHSPFQYVWRYQFGQEEKWHYCTIAASQNDMTPTDLSKVTPDGKLTVNFCIVNQCGSGEFEGKYCEPTKNDGRGEWVECTSGVCYDAPNGKPSCLACNETQGCAEDEHCIVKENPLNNYCESNLRTEACTCSAPANGHCTETTFEQTWNGSAWNPPSHQCAWECDTNYHPSGNGCAPDTRSQDCNNTIPQHSHYASPGTFTQTWNGTIWYPETSSCDWACDSNYHKEGNSCVYNHRENQYCTCPSDIPEHGMCNRVTFPQDWVNNAWSPSSETCDWTCTDGTIRIGKQCGTCADVVLDKGYDWNSSNPEEVWQAVLKGSEICSEANLGKACDFEAGRCVPCTSDYGCEDKQYCRLDPENPEKNKCEQSCIQGVLDITHLTPNISEWKPEDWEAAHAASLTVCEGLGFAGRVCDMTYGGCVPCTENYGCKDNESCFISPVSPELNACVTSCTELTLTQAELKLPLENQDDLDKFNITGISVCVETLGHKDTVCDLASGLCVPCVDGFGCKDEKVCIINEAYPILNECGKGCESDDQCNKDSNGKLPYCDKESGTCEPCQTGYHWDDKKEACVADKQDEKCDCSAPDYAHCTENTFQQIWNHQIEQWLPTSHQCAWDCNTNYHPSGNGCAPDTRPQACNNKPANSHYTGATTFTQTWNGSSWAPATASFSQCPWECDTNYNQSGDTCVAATQTIACNNSIPQHSHYASPGTFTQTWNGTIWYPETSSCEWACDTHYHTSANGSSCEPDTQQANCTSSKPAHSHYNPATFTQTWNGQAWDPATYTCLWECDSSYHKEGNSCVYNTRTTEYCTCPSLPETEICLREKFEQTWNGSGWSPSSKTCDSAACATGYHPNATHDDCEPDSCFDLTIQKTGLSLPSSHWNTQQWNLFNEGGKVVCKDLELHGTVCDPDSGLCVPCTVNYGCEDKQYCNIDPENPEKNYCEEYCTETVLEMAQLSLPTSNWTDKQWKNVRQKALEYCYSHGHEGMVCDFEYGGCVPCTEDYGCDEKQYCNIDSVNPEKNHCEESCVSTVLDKAHLSLPTSNWNPDDWAKARTEALAYCKDAGHEGMVCDFEYGGCVPCTTDYGCDDSTYCHLDPVNPEQNYCENSCTAPVIEQAGLSQTPISNWTPDDWAKAKTVALKYCEGLGYKEMVCDFEYGGCVPCTTDYGCNKEDYCHLDPEIPQNNQCEQSCIPSVLDKTGLQLPTSKWKPEDWASANAAGVSVCEDDFKQPGTVCDFEYGGCVPCTDNYGCKENETCSLSPVAPELNECITSCTQLTIQKTGLPFPLENPDQLSVFNEAGMAVCKDEFNQPGTVCDLNSGLCVPCVLGFGCEKETVCIVNELDPSHNECGKPCESNEQCSKDTNGALPFCINGSCERCQDGEHWDEGVGKCTNDIQKSTLCTCSQPSNAQCIETYFTQTWNHQIEQWMPSSEMCAWKCNDGYHQSGNICTSNTREISCNNYKPSHSHYLGTGKFEQTWNEDTGAWEPATSDCKWDCDTNYYLSDGTCIYKGGGGTGGGGGDTCADAGAKAVGQELDIFNKPLETPDDQLLFAQAHEAANKWCLVNDPYSPICHVFEDGSSECVACDELYPACMNGYKCEIHPEAPAENHCIETCRLSGASVYNQNPKLVEEANALGQQWCAEYGTGGVCDFDSGECVKCTATAGCDFEEGLQYCTINPTNPQENTCDIKEHENCYWATLKHDGYESLAEYGFWWNNPEIKFSEVLAKIDEFGGQKYCDDKSCDYPTGQCFTCTDAEGCTPDEYCAYTDDTHQERRCEPLKSDTACSLDGRLWWDGNEWTTCLGKCGPSFDKPEEFACGQSCSAYAWNNAGIPYDEYNDRMNVILAAGDGDAWASLTHLYSLGNAYCQKVMPEGSNATVCDMFTGQCVPPPVKE